MGGEVGLVVDESGDCFLDMGGGFGDLGEGEGRVGSKVVFVVASGICGGGGIGGIGFGFLYWRWYGRRFPERPDVA